MTLDKQASVEKIAHLRQVFCDPPRAFRPVLFWLWNGRLTAERLEAQLNDIAAHGFGGVVIHPMGENYRLGDFLEGITPPYLSDEYIDLVR
ncbi:MAG: hypothetical protein H5T86_10705, partial [Armatimonadetes bacterium]|nr:hypothetical protein [Armatimonadota bacterium]